MTTEITQEETEALTEVPKLAAKLCKFAGPLDWTCDLPGVHDLQVGSHCCRYYLTFLVNTHICTLICMHVCVSIYKKVKCSRYRPGVAQRVFRDRGTRRGWVVSSTPPPHFTPGKDPVPILQEAGWAPGPVWTGGKSRPHRDSFPDRPARSQSLYRLNNPAHAYEYIL